MKLAFLGAAGTVTGSKTLVSNEGKQVLIDCGLFQGYKNLRLMNWDEFPFDPKQLDAVVLTHAHLDHAGALPLLVKRGYRGPVFATPSTIDVCGVLLPDSGRIQEEDADYANRRGAEKAHVVAALRQRHPAARFSAYGNADSDFPHLELVDRPCLVNASASLRRRARSLGWRLDD